MSNILLIASTAMQAMSQIQQGQQMSANEKYNARVAESEAEAYRVSGAFESQALTQQSAFAQARIVTAKGKARGIQQAGYAKAGVLVFEGSPLMVMADTATEYELDIAANQYNRDIGLERIRYTTDVGVGRSLAEAEYRRKLGKYYKRASYWAAGQTLLTGMSSMKGSSGGYAVPGQGGYGYNTPSGVRNMGTYSSLPGY